MCEASVDVLDWLSPKSQAKPSTGSVVVLLNVTASPSHIPATVNPSCGPANSELITCVDSLKQPGILALSFIVCAVALLKDCCRFLVVETEVPFTNHSQAGLDPTSNVDVLGNVNCWLVQRGLLVGRVNEDVGGL